MKRIILVYGVIAGIIVAIGMSLAMAFELHSLIVGYLTMLIALSMVFVGIKRYRDEHLGGVIRFPTALLVGLGISLIACLIYALGWEAYLYSTDYTFMADYSASMIEQARAQGASPAELAAMEADMQGFIEMYESPLMRFLLTVSEIAPVALAVSLVSAALLRRRDFMPARGQ
jgi:hypothetical protein